MDLCEGTGTIGIRIAARADGAALRRVDAHLDEEGIEHAGLDLTHDLSASAETGW